MKKATGVIIVLCVFLSAFTGIHGENVRAEDYSDCVFYTVKRDVFYGYFERSFTSEKVLYTEGYVRYENIVYTKMFARCKSTGQSELLYEVRTDISDFAFADGMFYLLTSDGLYTCGINGDNMHLLIPGMVTCFDVNDTGIYYCIFVVGDGSQIIKCDHDGGNKVLLADETPAAKLSIINNGLIISSIDRVGKVSSDGQVEYFVRIFELEIPGMGAGDTGTHFLVGDRLIITGFYNLDHTKYGAYPTFIFDLEGNVLGVWENTVVRSIHESDGRIYAHIDNMNANGEIQMHEDEKGTSWPTGGTHHLSKDLRERRLVMQSLGIWHMYIKEDSILYCDSAGSWYKSDVMPDGSVINSEAEPTVEYHDGIEVLLMNENTTNEVSPYEKILQYRGVLLTFDVPPAMMDGEVLLPMRKVFQSMGAAVDWDDDARAATVEYGETELVFEEGCSYFSRNGVEIPLTIPAQIISGRLQVPLQAFIDAIGAQTEWNEARKAVWIWYS